ncbi:MAG TPA: sigma-70 family RNA polymerase sigma factor, partial [Anaerohalosphaeraceae bacterium]|nr:sigma-70 family RNA polymerase sigma factor [Anaerohalosphaeraceae bacterium]HOL32564.1 sigma-70 family RNA polymerase sigma factor [Anaerohalosphaeraceae bacterium]HOM77333.1 sigma-70 family RNA polymerase sigma factor [Anaerohalosphaeraceae bacterium]HPC65424.1 sigma-70 family RNA polymerase sigma factor [Anaerohalosphaeraceae bacterium]HRV21273.1 sigma-70 family RNA polymerase sigma factor [Anaerohalosphaeraceae bacterium]
MQNDKSEQFLSLFAKNQKRIYGFITVLVPQAVDADDLMQETMLVMWRRFNEFKMGTDFAAWGISVARRIVLKFYSERKNKALLFDDETMQAILQ